MRGVLLMIKRLYQIYKEDIPVLLFVIALIKFSTRWDDSYTGYIFFPVAFFLLLRMDLQRKLYVLIFLLPFAESKQLPRSIFGIMGLNPVNLTFVMVIIDFIRSKGRLIKQSSLNVPIIIFILMNFISAVRGMDAMRYLGEDNLLVYLLESFFKPMQIFLCGILAFNIFKDRDQASHFLRIVRLSGLLFGVWVLLRGGGTIESMRRLSILTGLQKNSISFLFTTLLAMNIATSDIGDKYERYFSWISSAVFLGVVMFTFSRQGYVTCVLITAFYAVKKGPKVATVYAICFILFWSFFIPFEVKKRIYYGTEKGLHMGLKDYTLGDVSSGRDETWNACLKEINKRPLFGAGKYSYLKRVDWERLGLPVHPHCAYLQSLMDMGILGSIFFVGFYFLLLGKSWVLYIKGKDAFTSAYSLGFFLCIMVFLLQALSGFRFYPNEESYYIWVFLGPFMWLEKNCPKSKTPQYLNSF